MASGGRRQRHRTSATNPWTLRQQEQRRRELQRLRLIEDSSTTGRVTLPGTVRYPHGDDALHPTSPPMEKTKAKRRKADAAAKQSRRANR